MGTPRTWGTGAFRDSSKDSGDDSKLDGLGVEEQLEACNNAGEFCDDGLYLKEGAKISTLIVTYSQ